MPDSFDPYYKWLAIPPAEQPPNYYRLLAVPLFTDDPDVIANAADQRMAYVRSLQGSQHVQHSQRLLNEISIARICLLQIEKKQAYDAELRARLATVHHPVISSVPLPLPPPVEPLPPPRMLATRIEATPLIIAKQASPCVVAPTRQRGPFGMVIAALGGITLFLGSLIVLLQPSWRMTVTPEQPHPKTSQKPSSEKPVAVKINNDSTAKQALSPAASKPSSINAKRRDVIAENSHRTLELNGVNAWLQTPLKYDGSHPLTIEVYLRPLGGEGTIIGNPEGAGLALEIRKSAATGEPVFAFVIHNDTKYIHLEGTQPVKYGDWTHLACVYDRKQMALFRNGKLEGVKALGGPHKASPLNFFIGCNAQTNGKHSSFTHAEFGNVSISKTARYQKNYLASHPLPADDDTLLLLLFDDGLGTKARDTSGHARHATIQNGVWHLQR